MPSSRILAGALAGTLLAAVPTFAAPPGGSAATPAASPAQGAAAGARAAAPAAKDKPATGSTPEIDAILKDADEQRRRGDYESALRRAREALAKAPHNPQALLLTGTLEAATNHADQALPHLREAIKLMPENSFARKIYASVLLEKHNPADALEALEPVLKLKPVDAEAHTMAAQIAASAGDFDQAGKSLDIVFKADPGYGPAHELAAHIALARHRNDEAQSHLEALIKAQPNNAAAMIGLANLYASQGRVQDAAAILERARKAAPKDPEPLIASAQFALFTKHADEAAGYIKGLEPLIPDTVSLLSLKGQLAMAQDRPKDAVTLLQSALAKQPVAEVMVQLHQAMIAAGQAAEADKKLDAWIAAHPADPRLQLYAADSLARRGDFAAASRHYREIVDKDPNNLVALNDLAQTLQAQHDPGAVEVAEKAYKLKPDSPVTENTLGGILMANGNAERGLGLLRDAASHAPKNPEVRFDYARALAVNGDKAKAKSELEALLALKQPFRNEAAAREMLKSLSGG